jgi:hypothetical protein
MKFAATLASTPCVKSRFPRFSSPLLAEEDYRGEKQAVKTFSQPAAA